MHKVSAIVWSHVRHIPLGSGVYPVYISITASLITTWVVLVAIGDRSVAVGRLREPDKRRKSVPQRRSGR